jgi:phytanoyl-CoA hydroxylase
MITEFDFDDLTGLAPAYERDGVAIIRNVLDSAFVAELDQHIDWLIARHPELRPESLGHHLIANDPFWVRFLSDKRLLDLAQVLVGPDIAFFAADYIAKPPRDGRAILWHQDANYWPLLPMEVFTVWFAVSHAGPQNGGVRFIPGSHHLGPQIHPRETESVNLLNSQVDPTVVDDSQAVDAVLEPGDVSIHHPYTLHGSEPNKSGQWRRGGSIQYMPTTTQVTDDTWPCVFLLRGKGVDGINHYRRKPTYRAGEHFPFIGYDAWT